ncbi:MAG: hypothetical protein JNL82_14420 [Myxococcales bacterium]|nr:hypothetical protein [Myxococcales bacterium]
MRLTAPKKAGPVPKEALDYWRRKKVKPGLDAKDAWAEEYSLAFTAAGVAAEDLLESMRRAVEQAIEEGLTFREFADRLDEVMVALGWAGEDGKPPWRLKLIYDTNMRVARAAGQYERVQRTKADRPYLVYALGPAEHHRDEHVGWAGTVLPVDDPFWATHWPPNGFNCRCHLRQVSTAEARRLGISAEAPDGDPDPGWDSNPGASRGS